MANIFKKVWNLCAASSGATIAMISSVAWEMEYWWFSACLQCVDCVKFRNTAIKSHAYASRLMVSIWHREMWKEIYSYLISCNITLCFVCSPRLVALPSTGIHGRALIWQFVRANRIFLNRLHSNKVFGNPLISAEKCPPSITIFSMPRQEIVAFYQRFDTKIVINSITFNKITGELLVNIYKRGKDQKTICSIILISL